MNTKVLIAPLNWGLGHATRCMPVIDMFRSGGADVILASDGPALDFLAEAYPDLPRYSLPAYRVRYPRRGSMAAHMLMAAPRIMAAIRAERRAVHELARKEKVQVIVSDNRYGCHVQGIRSILMTHQLHLRVPPAMYWAAPFVNTMNRRLISKFDTVWIPDLPGERGLAGALSHPAPAHGVYVGPLSRFGRDDRIKPKPCEILAICSGPEPQRTLLEELLKRELLASGKPAVLVRGRVTRRTEPQTEGRLTLYDWLPSGPLEGLVWGAGIVIARSGYSTVMDLVRLGKRAIFIPTPGQTEQEYLAKRLMERRIFYCETQSGFDLQRSLEDSADYPGLQLRPETGLLETAVQEAMMPV